MSRRGVKLPMFSSKSHDRSPTAMTALREADSARDASNWTVAERCYKKYLDVFQEDAGVWVQYGHALKESKALVQAEGAYRKALALAPNDFETRLHLSHLLKRIGHPEDIKGFFAEMLSLEAPPAMLNELADLVESIPNEQVRNSRPDNAVLEGTYLEVQDLFSYLSQHTTVTGITRVTLGIINYVLKDMDVENARKCLFVHQFGDAEGAMLISRENMSQVVRAVLDGEFDVQAMRSLLRFVKAASPVIQLGAGDTYLMVGAFWEFVGNPSWISGMRDRGAKIGTFIYDLIPITHHQYCMQGLTEAFTIAFAETVRLLDFALTISVYIGNEVKVFLTSHGVPPLPTLAVPLAHELRFEEEEVSRRSAATSTSTSARADSNYLQGIPFVLCVCTIEARKNHSYLFEIWQRMIHAGIDVPDLVFVGRPGWRVSDLMQQIEDSDYLNGRLHVLNGLTDGELSGLYDRCSFTVFPSFVEGWGLPVGESLAHGKVCVASSSSSIPEVGGDYVIYVDPSDLAVGYAEISRLICNPSELTRLELRISQSFVPRTWRDVGRDFFEKLNSLISTSADRRFQRPFFAPALRAGEILSVTGMSRNERRGVGYIQNPNRLVFLGGWRAVEVSGTWMLEDTARLRVQTACKPGERIHVLLKLGTSPWVGPQNTLWIAAEPEADTSSVPKYGDGYRRPMRANDTLWITVSGRVDHSGRLTVWLRVEGLIRASEQKAIPVGVRFNEMSYVSADDLTNRLGLLERTFLSPGSVLTSINPYNRS